MPHGSHEYDYPPADTDFDAAVEKEEGGDDPGGLVSEREAGLR